MALPSAHHHHHHHLLPLFLLLLGASCQKEPPSLSPSDASSLLDIRRSLRDLPGSSFFSSWDLPSADPCTSFAGVECSSDDGSGMHLRVLMLTLGTDLPAGSPGLAGTLSSSLSNLTALTDLVIYPGRISGSIPSNLASALPRLRLISISNNLISGPIPDSLAPGLHTLDLGHNRLSGPIPPPLFASSPKLKVLILASNGLSGELPPDLSASQLLHLDIRNNALDGALPPLPSTLRYLSAAANSLSGNLTAALGAAPPDLEFLDLSMNVFTGEIPAAIFSLPRLSYILLQRNNLSGAVPAPTEPTEPPPAAALVDLSHNALSGEAPAGLAGVANLFLNSNQLTGMVPEEYAKSVYSGTMKTFYAQQNFLTGFPAPPLPLPESASVCLAYNCMVAQADAAAGCPSGAGTQQSRPPEQCGGG